MDPKELARQFRISYYVLLLNLRGVTHEDSIKMPAQSGNCPNWILGHLLVSRSNLLDLLGREGFFTGEEAEPYRRGENGRSPELYLPLEKLVSYLKKSQKKVTTALEKYPGEDFLKTPAGADKDQKDTISEQAAFLHFHEAYHIGQIGLLRRIIGLEGAIA